ncbi:MAG: TIGR00159 family protein [Crocinitomicaceae bacterium]|nr:TIGR00159 family protein [Crocinitomicaceae bacterium]|tara:strand:- start:2302 stop:3090 length:789 start_codon:yes stop_codon:yes gene_type:complete
MLQFIHIDFLDVIDIVLVAVLIYQVYQMVRGTIAIRIFLGIFAIYLFWKIVEALHMELLSEILGQFIGVGVIVLIIVFQQELRNFLLMIGNTNFLNQKLLRGNIFHFGKKEGEEIPMNVDEIARACINMSESKTGALIIISHSHDIDIYLSSGEIIDARISSALLESIFWKNTPLHDGAVLIRDNTILAARCVLPVSENRELSASLGMRHRAAMGVSEQTSAISLIVSEQTGNISTIKEGKLKENVSKSNLVIHLKHLLKQG